MWTKTASRGEGTEASSKHSKVYQASTHLPSLKQGGQLACAVKLQKKKKKNNKKRPNPKKEKQPKTPKKKKKQKKTTP